MRGGSGQTDCETEHRASSCPTLGSARRASQTAASDPERGWKMTAGCLLVILSHSQTIQVMAIQGDYTGNWLLDWRSLLSMTAVGACCHRARSVRRTLVELLRMPAPRSETRAQRVAILVLRGCDRDQHLSVSDTDSVNNVLRSMATTTADSSAGSAFGVRNFPRCCFSASQLWRETRTRNRKACDQPVGHAMCCSLYHNFSPAVTAELFGLKLKTSASFALDHSRIEHIRSSCSLLLVLLQHKYSF